MQGSRVKHIVPSRGAVGRIVMCGIDNKECIELENKIWDDDNYQKMRKRFD